LLLSSFEVLVMHTLFSRCKIHTSSTISLLPFAEITRSACLAGVASLTLLLTTGPGIAAEPKAARATQGFVVKSPGSLLLVGGGNVTTSIRNRFVELAGGKKAHLVVVPTASTRSDRNEVSPSYLMWRSQDVSSVETLHTRDRLQADDPEFIKPLEQATGVWLGGGDQSRLTEAYQGTAFLRELRKVLDRGGVVGGTSAGASVVSSMMITGGTARAQLGTGFGFVPGMVVDQHFTNRNRMGRLLGILSEHPDMVGVGIDEQTAAVFQGDSLSVVGEASVYVCMSPTPTLPVNVQRLKSGEQVDLLSLSSTLMARIKTQPDRTAVTSATTPGREMNTGKGR
jgi:cyanophycinase